MKKANLLVMLVALGVIVWAVPVAPLHAASYSAVLTAHQDEPAEAPAQEAETQTFTGQIVNHDGTYELKGDDDKTYQLDDQEKAKALDGKKVDVTGTLNEKTMTIHVSEIEEAEA
jgi:Protein of unknown function (DUF5818)